MGSNFVEELKRVIVQAWPDMEPVNKIGSGAYGVVFECIKNAEGTDFSTKEAVKIIKIPRDIEEEYDDDCGMSPEEYFTALKDKAVSEIQVMDSLKGPHIVHINEYKVLNQSNQFGYYILIRMDLLTNLKSELNLHVNDNPENAERMAIKICRDMCDALQRCFERNMIHRDIKPENILMSEDGDFYLGDFGLARQFSNGTRNVSSRGTEDYMAPEVYLHGCNQITDLYSLGLVLYRIVNHNHILFYDEKNGTEGKDIAQNKRVSGQYQIPLPANCSEKFGKIVVKMCAYNPEDRFQSIAEIKEALDSIDHGVNTKNMSVDTNSEGTTNDSVSNTLNAENISYDNSDNNENTDYRGNYTQINNQAINVNNITYTSNTTAAVINGGNNKKNRKVAIIAIVAAIVLLGIGIVVGIVKIGKILANFENTTKIEKVENNHNVSEIKGVDIPDVVDEDSSKDVGKSIATLKMTEFAGAEIASGVEDTLGNKYDNVLRLYDYGKRPYATYYLNKDFSRFTADFSCLEYQTIDNDNSFRLEIYGNDEELLYSKDYTRSLAVTPIDIDVTGVEFLTIKITANWAGKGMGGIISNGMLYENNDVIPKKVVSKTDARDVSIASLKMVETEGAEIVNGVEDTLGNKYDNVLRLYDYGKQPYATYYLNKDFSRFTADFSCLEYQTIDNDNSFRLEIYGNDEELLYSKDYTRSLAVTPIDIDVTGVEFLTIKITANWAGKGMGGIISNGMLYAK